MIGTILGIVSIIFGLYLTLYLNEKNIQKSMLIKIMHDETAVETLKRAKSDGIMFIGIALLLLLAL